MSVVARLLSSGVARGFAALLAVLLSAVIGGRLGVDRLSLELTDEESSPVACPLVVGCTADLPAMATDVALRSIPFHHQVVTVTFRPAPCEHLQAPALLCGSAGGPRAP